MLLKGTYISPFGEPLPYIGETNYAHLPNGELTLVEVIEIRKIHWLENGRLEVEMLFERNEGNGAAPLPKKQLILVKGKKREQ